VERLESEKEKMNQRIEYLEVQIKNLKEVSVREISELRAKVNSLQKERQLLQTSQAEDKD
jgi:DNA repair ATPase RecN